ncbi:hypothetical protein ACWCYL_40770 [Streptomyces sp. 900105755]
MQEVIAVAAGRGQHGGPEQREQFAGAGRDESAADRVLPRLPALIISLTDHAAELNASGAPPAPAAAVEYLRAESISIIFDPTTRTLTADTPRGERITID